jgi:dihydroxyacetone kinase DhaKLM complex PTS-EIIA-like component DhaM
VIGLVLVSHSPGLAREVAALIAGLGFDGVRVAAAGGTDDGRMGTSADLVEAARREVDDGDGVVLLADLGSAVMTARLVVDDADDAADAADAGDTASGVSGSVRLADAPLVEGAIAAAGAAAAGGDLAAVLAAAESARDYRKL